jgi:hypothetical protein
VIQKKVVSPNNFPSLEKLSETLLAFIERYNRTAKPFNWKYTADDLRDLLSRISEHEKRDAMQQSGLTAAAELPHKWTRSGKSLSERILAPVQHTASCPAHGVPVGRPGQAGRAAGGGAAQDLPVGAGRGDGAVGPQVDFPSPAVDADVVVEVAEQCAVGDAGGAAVFRPSAACRRGVDPLTGPPTATGVRIICRPVSYPPTSQGHLARGRKQH